MKNTLLHQVKSVHQTGGTPTPKYGAGSITTLTKADINISMDGRGRYFDNIFIERLWRSLKQEAVYLHEFTDGFQSKRIIDNWIGFYNSERPHTAHDQRTPDTAYFTQAEPRKAA